MDSKRFVTCVGRLHNFQGLHVTFNKDGMSALRRLYGLSNSGLKIAEECAGTVYAVLASGDWQQDRNRTVTFWNMDSVDDDTLAHVARDIEKIECGDHFAKDLMVSRQKKLDEAVDRILQAVLTEGIIDEVESWGAVIKGGLVHFDDLPAITFSLADKATGEEIVAVAVDGWSGRYAINGEWGDRRFTDAQGVRERIYSALTDALDRQTAVA